MSQSQFIGNIGNPTGAELATIFDGMSKAHATLHSGPAEPDPHYPGMPWWDTASNRIKLRNAADNAWISIASFDGTTYVPFRGGVAINVMATLLNNLAATVDPVAGDDAADGYAVGSWWINVTGDRAWVCLDATNGAAVWRRISWATFGVSSSGVVPAPTQDDSDNLRVLRANGTWGASTEWTELQSITISSQATADLTSGSPETYQELRVRLLNIRPVTDGVSLQMQLRAQNAWQVSNDYQAVVEIPVGGSNLLAGGVNEIPLTYTNALGSGANEVLTGTYDVVSLGTVVSVFGRGIYLNSGGAPSFAQAGARLTGANGPCQGVRIQCSSGNLSSGTAILEGR